jgi:hypothetical protein
VRLRLCLADDCRSLELLSICKQGGSSLIRNSLSKHLLSISTTSACPVSRRALFRTSPWLDLAFARKLGSHVTGCGFQCPSHTEDRVSGGPLSPTTLHSFPIHHKLPRTEWPKPSRWIGRRRNKPSMSPQAGPSLAQAGRFSRFLALAFAAVSRDGPRNWIPML